MPAFSKSQRRKKVYIDYLQNSRIWNTLDRIQEKGDLWQRVQREKNDLQTLTLHHVQRSYTNH